MSDLDYDGAAAQLGLSPAWMKKHIRELPHLKLGRLVRFTPDHLEQIRRRFEQRPSDTPPVGELRPARRRRSA